MGPGECIAALDNALAENGECIVLRRRAGLGNSGQNIDVTVRAIVRNFRLKEVLLVDDLKQAILLVTISPTQIKKAQWPGGGVPGQAIDPSMPRRTDQLQVKGHWYTVDACEAIGNPPVRYNMQARG